MHHMEGLADSPIICVLLAATLTNIFIYQEIDAVLRATAQLQVSFEDFKYARFHDAIWLCE